MRDVSKQSIREELITRKSSATASAWIRIYNWYFTLKNTFGLTKQLSPHIHSLFPEAFWTWLNTSFISCAIRDSEINQVIHRFWSASVPRLEWGSGAYDASQRCFFSDPFGSPRSQRYLSIGQEKPQGSSSSSFWWYSSQMTGQCRRSILFWIYSIWVLSD